MTACASYEITVVVDKGMYVLGYYSASAAKFFVIEQFSNGRLAQAAAYCMNQERER